MISGGSCDTDDWSNDAENSALITGINYLMDINVVMIFSSIFDQDLVLSMQESSTL